MTTGEHPIAPWWESAWFRSHVTLAPFGITVMTWVLCWSVTSEWRIWNKWADAASLVDLAVILYGVLAVTVERVVQMIWWALEKRREHLEKRRQHNEKVRRDERVAIAERFVDMSDEDRLKEVRRLIEEITSEQKTAG